MCDLIYAVKVANLSYSGLKIYDVKIGQTKNIKSTLAQYKRSNRNIEVLNLWLVNKDKTLTECEKGVHKIAEQYAYEREGEKFIFLQESYNYFADTLNLILKETTVDAKPKNKRSAESVSPISDDYINKKIDHFVLFDKKHKPRSWQDLLMTVITEMYERHKEEFDKSLSLKGTKMSYFSRNKKELSYPKQIANSQYYAEAKLNANSIVKRCKDLMVLFGYEESSLIIYTRS